TADVFFEATPARFEQWLLAACRQTVLRNMPAERLVFINAWNEWGEGCYLEPDTRHGYGYLEAVKRVANECRRLAQCLDAISDPGDHATRASISAIIDSYERSLSAIRFLRPDSPSEILEALLSGGFLDTPQGRHIQDHILRERTDYFELRRELDEMSQRRPPELRDILQNTDTAQVKAL